MSLFSNNNPGGTGGFGGGGGGFGANNNNQPGTTGSVFGTGGGFGQSGASGFGNTGGGFGQPNQNTPGAFGAATNTGFGAPNGGFGANNNAATSPFGAKTAFGAASNAPATGGLFGNTAANTNAGGGGAFGFGTQQQPSNVFGGNNTAAPGGGGLFGNKPPFGTATTTAGTTGGLFNTAGAQAGGAFGNPGGNTGIGGFGGASNQGVVSGTANPPYQAFQEKEAQGGTTNHFQTIAFMPAYHKYSLEELRLQDYALGRRYGNEGGGAFGGTGFGGNFTNTANTGAFGAGNTTATSGGGGGLFGNSNVTSTPFGTQPANSAFGGNTNTTTGGLFGAQKPAASGGLFGGAGTATTGGGLFGANSNSGAAGAFGNTAPTTGFGTNANSGGGGGGGGSGGGTGGGLFGSNQANQNNQAKPFAFTNTPTTGFGTTATAGGAFGGNTGGGLFGNNQNPQQQPTANTFGAQQPNTFGGGGAFGTNPAQNQPATGFGAFGGGPQQQQNKPAFGAFGTNTTTNNTAAQGGLFGGGQPLNTGGLFANQNKPFGTTPTPTQPTGGLFGNNTAPQTNTGGGLFGIAQPAANTGGLFGNQQNPGNSGGGLFGNALNKPPGGGLFNNNAVAPTQNAGGGGLFGGGLNTSLNTAPSGGLFGNGQQQAPQQMGNSLFSSFNQNQQGQQQQQQQLFTTSIHDSPYGNSLMASMNNYPAPAMGPIATPLSASIQTKKAAQIPHYKIAPRQPTLQPRLGSSFSRSGSPFAASTSTSTALGAGTSLSRSFSTNNKLHLFDGDDSVLSSGAFTPGTWARVANLKKLIIDKKIRDQDLFSGGQDLRKDVNNENVKGNSTKGILKKTVSFDVTSNKESNSNFFSAQSSRETVGPTPSAEEMGYLRSPSNGRRNNVDSVTNGATSTPDAQPESSTALAVVEQPKEDKSHGSYWMVPNAQKLKAMPKEQLKRVIGLTIGRRGFGQVRFDNPVDLTAIEDIDQIPGNVVIFDQRVCTVYPETMDKPPPGRGLNVPATITLEDCFPFSKNERGKIRDPEHPRYITHIRRLKGIKDTEFVDYLANEGIWIFKVRHFTTYGLVDSVDEGDVTYDESYLGGRLPTGETPTTTKSSVTSSSRFTRDDSVDASDADVSVVDTTGGFDDTFDFKRMGSSAMASRNSRNDGFPGSFLGASDEVDTTYDTYEEESAIEEEEEGEEEEGDTTMAGESFLGEGSVGSVEDVDEPAEPASEEDEGDETAHNLTVVEEDEEDDTVGVNAVPEFVIGGLKEGTTQDTPRALPVGRDWTEQLNATISPVKKRFGGTNFFSLQKPEKTSPMKKMEPLNYGVLDLANDLYGGSAAMNGSATKRKGNSTWAQFEFLSASTRSLRTSTTGKNGHHDADMSGRTMGLTWRSDGTLFSVRGGLEGSRESRKGSDALKVTKLGYSVRDPESQGARKALELQLKATTIKLDQYNVPRAETNPGTPFQSFAELSWTQSPADQHEKNVWALASVLFDPITERSYFDDETDFLIGYMQEKCRKEKLSKFLELLVEADADDHAHSANTLEEVAFAHLTAHRVEQACAALLEAGDYRLSSLIPMIGGDIASRELIKRQIDEWRKKGVLAEIAVAIRALYELLSGNTSFSEGVRGPLEDTAPEFFLPERFGLDWKRSFGLKLWYGCSEEGSIGRAVLEYEEEMRRWPESVPVPLPWYHDASSSLNDDTLDILWGLLRLYAEKDLSLEDVLSPKSVNTSNIDLRMSWQLGMFLAKKEIRGFSGARMELQEDGSEERVPGSMADQLTADFAGILETAGLWEWAIFVVLHLAGVDSRKTYITNVLGRHLDELEDAEGPEIPKKLEFLEKTLLIPKAWIFEARALKARQSEEYLIGVEYLLSAQAWNQAHKTIIQQVAPEAVISGDLEQLKAILAKFENVSSVERWNLGGQIYLDYITLVESVQGDRPTARNAVVVKTEKKGLPNNRLKDVAKRLLVNLKNADRKLFLQNVAVREMAGVVGSWVLKSGEMIDEAGEVLGLPLTEDQYLRKTMHLSHSYYKAKLQEIH